MCLLLQYLLQSCSHGGEGDSGGHMLRETTSRRGLCGLVCPSRTSEGGGEGDCLKGEGVFITAGPYYWQSCLRGPGGAREGVHRKFRRDPPTFVLISWYKF